MINQDENLIRHLNSLYPGLSSEIQSTRCVSKLFLSVTEINSQKTDCFFQPNARFTELVLKGTQCTLQEEQSLLTGRAHFYSGCLSDFFSRASDR